MIKKIIISLLISLGIGGLSFLLTNQSMDIYKYLIKPMFAPPSIAFSIVWPILYFLMGISSYLIYESKNKERESALYIYLLQLGFNFIWSILFFVLNYRLFAFIWIIILLLLIIVMILKFYKINKTAAYLQIPYLLWVMFATYLNFGLYVLNR